MSNSNFTFTCCHFYVEYKIKVYTMERIEQIESKEAKGQKTISIHLRNGNEPRVLLSPQVSFYSFFPPHLFLLIHERLILKDEVSWIEWKKALNEAIIESQQTYTVTEKASKIYGAQEAKRIIVQE